MSLSSSTTQLETVTIKNSTGRHGVLYISGNSDLFMRGSVISGSGFDLCTAIYCFETSRIRMESVLVSSFSAFPFRGSVYSFRCSLIADNVTFRNTTHAVAAYNSTINFFNSFSHNNTGYFLSAESSNVTFWNFKLTAKSSYLGNSIVLRKSFAEFRHTLLVTEDETCPLKDRQGSTIKLRSLYFIGSTSINQSESRVVCKALDTVVQGSPSGKTKIPLSHSANKSIFFSKIGFFGTTI